MGRITATCVTQELKQSTAMDPRPTGIDKGPVSSIEVRRAGALGDQVLDTAHHGGVDKALYAYADEDAAWWAEQLDEEVEPGRFGENLRTSGIDVGALVIGTRLRIGDDVLVEVSEPRVPCTTFQHHMGDREGWVRWFTEENRTGTYLRVLSPGTITADDEVVVDHVPDHGVTIAGWFGSPTIEDARALVAADEADDEWQMASSLRGNVEYVLSQG